MFNKLSLKIGMLFFVFILIVQSVLFIFLYTNLANDRIDEVLGGLLARGNSHRNVLERSFETVTLKHVALMETDTETIVVIPPSYNRLQLIQKWRRLWIIPTHGNMRVKSLPISGEMKPILQQKARSK